MLLINLLAKRRNLVPVIFSYFTRPDQPTKPTRKAITLPYPTLHFPPPHRLP